MTTTYHGDPEFKAAFLAEIAAHEAADAIVQGTYGKVNGTWRGCAVGCSLRSLHQIKGRPLTDPTNDHVRLAMDLGWPLWLAHLEDHIFEHLPVELAREWPRRLAEAIPEGIVIGDVALAKILRWLLADGTYGARHVTYDDDVVAVVDRMIALFDRVIGRDTPSGAEFDFAVITDARAAWVAWVAQAAWDIWAARDAWDAGDVWVAITDRVARDDDYYKALSDHVIATVRRRASEPV